MWKSPLKAEKSTKRSTRPKPDRATNNPNWMGELLEMLVCGMSVCIDGPTTLFISRRQSQRATWPQQSKQMLEMLAKASWNLYMVSISIRSRRDDFTSASDNSDQFMEAAKQLKRRTVCNIVFKFQTSCHVVDKHETCRRLLLLSVLLPACLLSLSLSLFLLVRSLMLLIYCNAQSNLQKKIYKRIKCQLFA